MKVWHMRLGAYGRAFAPTPTTSVAAIWWWARGWRPFNGQWWSKPSKNQRRLECGHSGGKQS